jgi:hypothetical protein
VLIAKFGWLKILFGTFRISELQEEVKEMNLVQVLLVVETLEDLDVFCSNQYALNGINFFIIVIVGSYWLPSDHRDHPCGNGYLSNIVGFQCSVGEQVRAKRVSIITTSVCTFQLWNWL